LVALKIRPPLWPLAMGSEPGGMVFLLSRPQAMPSRTNP
jgi:hypothetical protein